MLQRVCVFCGSSFGTRPVYAEAARELGRVLTERGIELVYGGSHLRLMGALADACLARGGRVTGVMPRALVEKEIPHRGLTELRMRVAQCEWLLRSIAGDGLSGAAGRFFARCASGNAAYRHRARAAAGSIE